MAESYCLFFLYDYSGYADPALILPFIPVLFFHEVKPETVLESIINVLLTLYFQSLENLMKRVYLWIHK